MSHFILCSSFWSMDTHANAVWMAYLTNILISNCIIKAKNRCAGCKNNIQSPLLHYHFQSSLLDKVKEHFEEVRGPIISNIEKCFTSFIKIYDSKTNKKNFLFSGQTFLLLATPESIFYGRYMTEEMDSTLFPKNEPLMENFGCEKLEESHGKKRKFQDDHVS